MDDYVPYAKRQQRVRSSQEASEIQAARAFQEALREAQAIVRALPDEKGDAYLEVLKPAGLLGRLRGEIITKRALQGGPHFKISAVLVGHRVRGAIVAPMWGDMTTNPIYDAWITRDGGVWQLMNTDPKDGALMVLSSSRQSLGQLRAPDLKRICDGLRGRVR